MEADARTMASDELTLRVGALSLGADQLVAGVELAPDARWVAEYYPVDELVELPQGRARVRMRYSDRSWMTRLLLGLGGQVRVLNPTELACDVRQRAKDALVRARHLPST